MSRTTKNKARHTGLTSALPLLLVPLTLGAQETDAPQPLSSTTDSAVSLQVFQGPKAKDLKLEFPFGERWKGREGWALVNFMVDDRGKPYEAAVIDSTGNENFNKSAVEAVEDWTFEPASLNGKPIHSSQNYKITFKLTDGEHGASPQFVRAYKAFTKAVENGDQAAADAELAKLEVHNLYEDAYVGLAHYSYNLKWGTAAGQLAALNRAIADEATATYLPKKLFEAALTAIFPLQVQVQDFAGAMITWEKLQKNKIDAAVLKPWEETIAELQKLKQDDRAYRVPGTISKGTSWYYRLFKNKFQVDVIKGRVDEVKLRCEKQYVLFPFQPDLEYKIADKHDSCSLELVGKPGSTFELRQS